MDKTQYNPLPPQELCPFDSVKWERLKGRWNCTDQELYHCLPNQYNYPGQICVKPNWVLKNYCPIYNTVAAKIDLIPCDSQYGACSDNDYRSNLVYMYSGCLNKTEILKDITKKPPKEVPPFLSILIPSAVVVAVLLLVALAIWLFCRRRKVKKNDTCEMEPLLGQSDIPPGFQKAFDYLKHGVFYPSKLYENAIGALDVHHSITIVGPPGSGKTLTAVQLAYRKCGVGGKSQLYFCRTLEEVRCTAAEKKDAYIIVDDWLDWYVYYPSKIDQAVDLLNDISEDFVKNGKVHLILTTQEDKYVRFSDFLKKCCLFNPKCLVTINSETFNKKGRQGMILRHFHHFDIEESGKIKMDEFGEKTIVCKNAKDNLSKNKEQKEFSFPVIIDLICTNTRLLKARNLIKKDGFKHILTMFFDKWSKEEDAYEKKSFCILVFAALLGGKVSPTDFKSVINGPIFVRVCSEYNCNITVKSSCEENGSQTEKLDDNGIIQKTASLEEIETCKMLLVENERLRGCLYKSDDRQGNTVFIFQHSSLFRFVLSYIKECGEKFFIDNVNIGVLTKECWLEEKIIDKFKAKILESPLISPVGSVILSTKFFKVLAERIRSEKELHVGYDIPEWDNYIFMSHDTFKTIWRKVESEKPHQSQP